MPNKYHRGLFWGFTALYMLLTIILPSDPATLQRYDMTHERAQLLKLAISIPLTLIWLAAFHGITKLQEYTDSINESKEGPWFSWLSRGLSVLVLGLPIVAAMGSYISYIRYTNPDLLPGFTILRNYISLLFAMVAFLMIAKGAEGLMRTLKSKDIKASPRLGLIGAITLSSLYTWPLASQPHGANDETGSFFLPNVLILFTLVIPYVFVWCKGLIAAYHIYVYKNRVKGRIYKKGLSSLAQGITAIIVLSLFLQFLTTVSPRLRFLSLKPVILLIYTIIALTAVGYGLIAKGSRKLKQIEEV